MSPSSRLFTLSCLLRYAQVQARHRILGHRILTWFTLDPRVKLLILPILRGSLLPRADVTVLTAWQTAVATTNPARRAGRLVQVVYDYEFWVQADDETRAQMRSALSRTDVALLATSSVVKDMLTEMGLVPAGDVPAGIDLSQFYAENDGSERSTVVGFAARTGEAKGMATMVNACKIIRSHRDDISFLSYGHELPAEVPDYVLHLGPLSPDRLREFYNACLVFVLPSDHEGWGLPAVEAMACGAALVTTANGGAEDFAIHRVNALIVPPQEPGALAAAIEQVVDDARLYRELTHKALQKAKTLGIDDAVDRLEKVLIAVVSSK